MLRKAVNIMGSGFTSSFADDKAPGDLIPQMQTSQRAFGAKMTLIRRHFDTKCPLGLFSLMLIL